MLKQVILECFTLIKNNQGVAYFVGGAVRDFLIENKTNTKFNKNIFKTQNIDCTTLSGNDDVAFVSAAKKVEITDPSISIKQNQNLASNKNQLESSTSTHNNTNQQQAIKNDNTKGNEECNKNQISFSNTSQISACKNDEGLDNFLQYLALNNKDIDIATNLHPEIINKIFTNNGYMAKQTIVTNIVVKNRIKLEITTLRKDINPDGRWTQTQFAQTIQEDSKRRDFTINAIYLEPIFEKNLYNLHDFYNGIDDVKNGVVKFIGNAESRIKEDYLRILRFFRFSCRFSKTFNTDGLNACINLQNNYKAACKTNSNGIVLLAKERVKDEIFKILSHRNYQMFLDAIQDSNLSESFFNIKHEEFALQKLHLYNILNIFNDTYKISPLWLFLSLAGLNQDIILLSRKEEFLVNIVKFGTQINGIFDDSFKYFTMPMRVREFFASHNKNQNDTITQDDFVGILLLYFVKNNIDNYTDKLTNILQILNQIV